MTQTRSDRGGRQARRGRPRRSKFAEKSKESYPQIRNYETHWVNIRLEDAGGQVTGRLLHLSQGVDPNGATITFVNVLPTNQCKGAIKINVDKIKTIKLDEDLNYHFNEATDDVQREIIDCLEGRGAGEEEIEIAHVEEEEEEEKETEKENEKVEDVDYMMMMMMEQEEEKYNEIDDIFREVEMQFQMKK